MLGLACLEMKVVFMGLVVMFQTPVWSSSSLSAACSEARQMEKNRWKGGKNPQLADFYVLRENGAELRIRGAARGTWNRVSVSQVTFLTRYRMRKVAALLPGRSSGPYLDLL